MGLEAIIEYEMPPLHAKAYKLCLIWEKILDHCLPGYYKNRLPKKGDPRDSLIFRYCLKLVKETLGLIPDDEYKLYIYAQIDLLKNLGDGKAHALIEPVCLVGEKAWIRWKVWKKKYDKAHLIHNNQGDTSDITAGFNHVLSELNNTKEFLVSQMGEDYEIKIVENIKNTNLFKWVAFAKVSPYYLVLSPIIAKNIQNLEGTFSFEIEIYKRSITKKIWEEFKIIFENEFNC